MALRLVSIMARNIRRGAAVSRNLARISSWRLRVRIAWYGAFNSSSVKHRAALAKQAWRAACTRRCCARKIAAHAFMISSAAYRSGIGVSWYGVAAAKKAENQWRSENRS